MHGVLTKVPGVKDCVNNSDCALSICTMARPEGSGIGQIYAYFLLKAFTLQSRFLQLPSWAVTNRLWPPPGPRAP